MKRLATVLLLVIVCQVAHSQILIALVLGNKLQSEKLEFGLTVNPTLCNVTDSQGEPRTGLGFGLYFNVKLNQNLFFHPEGIPKSAFGEEKLPAYSLADPVLDSLYANATVQRKIKAMSLPLLMRYRVWKLLFIEAGPQFDLMLTVKDEFKIEVGDDEMLYKKRVTDQFTRLDMGFAIGLVYKLKKDKGMGLGVRYFAGLTDIMKTKGGNQTNQTLLVTIGIPIGSSPTEEEKKGN